MAGRIAAGRGLAITYKMQVQQPTKTFCNFMQKRLAKNNVLVELARVLHTTPEYIMTGSEPDEDPYVIEAAALIRSLKTEKAKKAALEHIRLVMMMES